MQPATTAIDPGARPQTMLTVLTQKPLTGKPSDAHDLRHVQPRALGRKASDEFAVPLCRSHHRAIHRAGDERAWWQATGIDPVKVARKLWKRTRVNEGRIRLDRMTQSADSDRALQSSDADSKAPA
jgi:hypothetical protein